MRVSCQATINEITESCVQFSIRTLLALISAISVSLALAQINFGVGCLILVGIVIVALSLFIRGRLWRYCIYGAVSGMAFGILLMLAYMWATEGRIRGATYSQIAPLNEIVLVWRAWIIYGGSLVGGTLGAWLFQIPKDRDCR